MHQGQGEPEGTALVDDTGDLQFTPHQFHQLTADGQPQAGTTITPGGGTVGLNEGIENAAFGELDGIAQQIDQYLADTTGIGADTHRHIHVHHRIQDQIFLACLQ